MSDSFDEYYLEPYYRVTIWSSGAVTIHSDHRNMKGRELKQWPDARGYLRVVMYNRHNFVHGIVMKAVVGEKPIGYVVNHKDANKLNNHPSNLEYCTQKENIQHAVRMGLFNIKTGKENHCYKDGRSYDQVAYKKWHYQQNKALYILRAKESRARAKLKKETFK